MIKIIYPLINTIIKIWVVLIILNHCIVDNKFNLRIDKGKLFIL